MGDNYEEGVLGDTSFTAAPGRGDIGPVESLGEGNSGSGRGGLGRALGIEMYRYCVWAAGDEAISMQDI